MIEIRGLTKTYGDTVAVDDLTFEVRPGVVTGFLGPNGAGKSHRGWKQGAGPRDGEGHGFAMFS